MTSVEEFNRFGAQLEQRLRLQTAPVAVKMLESEADIPSEAFSPYKDRGEHYAQCQAFSLSRRNRTTVAMLKADNWCPAPLIAYGLVPRPEDDATRTQNPQTPYDCFALGRYIGILTAPLPVASFVPQVVIIYCDTQQLRNMLLCLQPDERPLVKSNFFPFSCAYAVTSPILNNDYWINLPDPGEFVRALTQTGEMMFSIPAKRLAGFMENLAHFCEQSPFFNEQMMMRPDFPQPELYAKIFRSWGMVS